MALIIVSFLKFNIEYIFLNWECLSKTIASDIKSFFLDARFTIFLFELILKWLAYQLWDFYYVLKILLLNCNVVNLLN